MYAIYPSRVNESIAFPSSRTSPLARPLPYRPTSVIFHPRSPTGAIELPQRVRAPISVYVTRASSASSTGALPDLAFGPFPLPVSPHAHA
jgi:hypothetical protein